MTDALIGLTLDRSGSMRSMWPEAVAGYNTFKNEQAAEEGTAYFVTTYFDNEVKQGFFGKNAKNVPDLTPNDDEVFPRGLTALVDATISTITETERWLNEHPSFDGKVFQVVITDGAENASKASPATLKELVQSKEAEGWEFIYLAANVDLDATRSQYGFSLGGSVAYDVNSVDAVYATTSAAVTRSRSGHQGDLFDESDRDLTGTGR